MSRVNSNGLEWTVVSRNERYIEHCGRHFYAGRCRPSSGWILRELDRDPSVPGRREIARAHARFQTAELSLAVMSLCDETPAHAKPWLCPHCFHVNGHDFPTCSCCHTPFAQMEPLPCIS